MRRFFLLLSVILAFPCVSESASLHILTTIKPVQALIAGVTEGVTEPDVLVGQNDSPHNYSMRPSDAAKLQQADIIFMVGRHFEMFLDKPLSNLTHTTIVELVSLPGVKTLPVRSSVLWADDDDPKHLEGPIDNHLWLDSDNAVTIVNSAALILGIKDPEHAAIYRQNAEKMVAKLHDMDKKLATKLAPYGNIAYIVSHDAYQYFETRYHLRAVAAISLTPDQAPGAKTLAALEEDVTRYQAVCLFTEPHFPQAFIDSIANNTHIGIGELDAEWGAVPGDKGSSAYFTMMNGLANHLIDCFDKKHNFYG